MILAIGKPRTRAFWVPKGHLAVAATQEQYQQAASGAAVCLQLLCAVRANASDTLTSRRPAPRMLSPACCGWLYIFCSKRSFITSEQNHNRELWVKTSLIGITLLIYFSGILMPHKDGVLPACLLLNLLLDSFKKRLKGGGREGTDLLILICKLDSGEFQAISNDDTWGCAKACRGNRNNRAPGHAPPCLCFFFPLETSSPRLMDGVDTPTNLEEWTELATGHPAHMQPTSLCVLYFWVNVGT